MGAAALPPTERATLVAGRLIREGLLQQSALSPVDASCGAARAAALADAVLAVAGRCLELAGRGVDPAAIEDQDFSPVLRAREEAGDAGDGNGQGAGHARPARRAAWASQDGGTA